MNQIDPKQKKETVIVLGIALLFLLLGILVAFIGYNPEKYRAIQSVVGPKNLSLGVGILVLFLVGLVAWGRMFLYSQIPGYDLKQRIKIFLIIIITSAIIIGAGSLLIFK